VNMLKGFSLCELSLIWKHFIALDHVEVHLVMIVIMKL